MKKYILSGVFAVMSIICVSAQDYKMWAGGRTTLWAGDGHSTIVVAPEVGYHLNKTFTVAASVGFHSYNYDEAPDMSGVVFNPYIRYNAFKKGVLFGYVDGGVEFGIGDMKGIQVGLKPGIAVAITNRFVVALQYGFIGFSDGKGNGFGVNRAKGIGIDLSGYQSGLAFFYAF
jgi:hypothetical protein